MNIVQLIPDYLDYCHYQKNLSADTLKAYRIDLNQFAVYWAGTDGAPTRGNLAQYVVVLQKQFQPRTARRKTASVKAFFGWLIYMELVEFDPFQKLRVKFNEPKILPRTIPLTLIAQLLSAVYQAVLDGVNGPAGRCRAGTTFCLWNAGFRAVRPAVPSCRFGTGQCSDLRKRCP